MNVFIITMFIITILDIIDPIGLIYGALLKNTLIGVILYTLFLSMFVKRFSRRENQYAARVTTNMPDSIENILTVSNFQAVSNFVLFLLFLIF